MLNWFLGSKEKVTPGESSTPVTAAETETVQEVQKEEGIKSEEAGAKGQDPSDFIQIRQTCPPFANPVSPKEREIDQKLDGIMADCEKIISAPGFDLPMLPAVAMRVLDLVQDPKASLGEISKQVTYDAVMSAKFLRMANSAFYGGATKIESIQQALARLGLVVVKNLVMSIGLQTTIFKDTRLKAFAKKFWEHSLGCAIIAQEFAPLMEASKTSVFMAALLHDIGKVPALLFIQKILPANDNVRPAMIESWIEKHHIRAGIALMNHWKLPVEARLAMAAHHQADDLDQAHEQVTNLLNQGGENKDDIEILIRTLVCLVLSDRAMASLGFADEPGMVDIVGSKLALDVDLSNDEIVDFLRKVPKCVEEARNMF